MTGSGRDVAERAASPTRAHRHADAHRAPGVDSRASAGTRPGTAASSTRRSSGPRGSVGRRVQRAASGGVLLFRGASRAIASVPERVSAPIARARSGSAITAGRPSDASSTPTRRTSWGCRRRSRGSAAGARHLCQLLPLHARPDAPAACPGRRAVAPDATARARHDRFWRSGSAARPRAAGIIVVSGHIGSIDIFAGAYAQRGIPTYGLADDTAYPELFELLNRQRTRWGVTIIPWRNLREIFRIMRTPAVLGMVVDWGYRPDDLPVRLFGEWTTLPAGPATLAARTGAVDPAGRGDASAGRHLSADRAGADRGHRRTAATLLAATQRIADALEELVRAGAGPVVHVQADVAGRRARRRDALAAAGDGDGAPDDRIEAPAARHRSRGPTLGQRTRSAAAA